MTRTVRAAHEASASRCCRGHGGDLGIQFHRHPLGPERRAAADADLLALRARGIPSARLRCAAAHAVVASGSVRAVRVRAAVLFSVHRHRGRHAHGVVVAGDSGAGVLHDRSGGADCARAAAAGAACRRAARSRRHCAGGIPPSRRRYARRVDVRAGGRCIVGDREPHRQGRARRAARGRRMGPAHSPPC